MFNIQNKRQKRDSKAAGRRLQMFLQNSFAGIHMEHLLPSL
jgi:hypothetical protein